jgi:hypothetical protein
LFKSFIKEGEGDEGAMVDKEGMVVDDSKGVDEEEGIEGYVNWKKDMGVTK